VGLRNYRRDLRCGSEDGLRIFHPALTIDRFQFPLQRSQRGCVGQSYVGKMSEAQIGRVVEIVSDRGGLDYARRRGDEYAREAEMALVDLPDTPARGALHDAIAYALDRSQ